MGCGCGRKSGVQSPPSARSTMVASSATARTSTQFYDVYNLDGGLVASFTNIVTARAEARRLNGTAVPRERGTDAQITIKESQPLKEEVPV